MKFVQVLLFHQYCHDCIMQIWHKCYNYDCFWVDLFFSNSCWIPDFWTLTAMYVKISHKSELKSRFWDFNSKICDFLANSWVKVLRKDYNYKTIVITILCSREWGFNKKLYIFRYKRFRSWKNLPGGVWNKEKVSTFASANKEKPWDIQWT